MASTYVNDLRLEEMATGDQSGTWGDTTNTNLELIAEAFSYGTQASFGSDADATTTIADGASDPARSLYLKVTSGVSLTATRTLTIAPNTVSKIWIIENATSGSQSISISQGSGANITIPNGDVKVIYTDGAGSGAAVVDAFTDLNTSGTLTATNIAGTLITAAQPNITSVGTLTALTGGTGDLNWDSGTLFVDSSANAVGIGLTNPSDYYATELVVDASDEGGISVVNGTTEAGYLAFADGTSGTDRYSGYLSYDHNVDALTSRSAGYINFMTGGGTERMRIDSGGRVMIAETSNSGYSANADDLIVGDNGAATERGISIGSTAGGGIRWNDGADAGIIQYVHSSNAMQFYTANSLATTIDASGNVIIGSGGLDVSGVGGTYTALNMRAGAGYPILYGQTTATTTNSSAMQIVGATSGASAGGAAEILGTIQIAAESDSSTNGAGYINFYTGSGGSPTERMRIDSSGNLLVGTTSTTVGGATSGYGFRVDGANGIVQAAASGNTSAILNRTSSDGAIVSLRKNGSEVGSIGSEGGDLVLGTGTNCGIQFNDGNAAIRPFNIASNAAVDAAVDLGVSGTRFKDLYLSGNVRVDAGQGIYFGGAAGASGMTSQVLDDYEEGTFDPTLTPASGSVTAYTSYNTLAYTKVGRVVTITGLLALQSVSSPSGIFTFGNLPFAMASLTNRAGRTMPTITLFASGSGAPTQNKYYPAFINFGDNATQGTVFAMYNSTHDDSIGDWLAAGSDLAVNFSYVTN